MTTNHTPAPLSPQREAEKPRSLTVDRVGQILTLVQSEDSSVGALKQAVIDLLDEMDRRLVERQDLKSRLSDVLDICDREQRNAMRWENPLPMPEWVAVVQRAALGDGKRKGGA
ncbi:hypothetical protein [Streptomyces antimycoticus]